MATFMAVGNFICLVCSAVGAVLKLTMALMNMKNKPVAA